MAEQDIRAEVEAALARLDRAVAALRDEYGPTLGTRRLVSDVRRFTDDLDELGDPAPGHRAARQDELEEIPDAPYDPSMWADAEDEGFGAPDRHAP
jgi:hypothetical protein